MRCGLNRFRADQRGVVAIEFALLAIPFFFVLFASIETAIVMGAGVVLDNAVDDAARLVLTGQTQTADITADKFKQTMCDNISMMMSCSRLKVDMRTFATFGAIPGDVPSKLGNVDDSSFCFDPGAQDNITVVRAFYEWPWVTGLLQRATSTTNGQAVLFSMAAFMNEPFGTKVSTKSTCKS